MKTALDARIVGKGFPLVMVLLLRILKKTPQGVNPVSLFRRRQGSFYYFWGKKSHLLDGLALFCPDVA